MKSLNNITAKGSLSTTAVCFIWIHLFLMFSCTSNKQLVSDKSLFLNMDVNDNPAYVSYCTKDIPKEVHEFYRKCYHHKLLIAGRHEEISIGDAHVASIPSKRLVFHSRSNKDTFLFVYELGGLSNFFMSTVIDVSRSEIRFFEFEIPSRIRSYCEFLDYAQEKRK